MNLGIFTAGLTHRSERWTIPLVRMPLGTRLIPEPPQTPLLRLGTPVPCLHSPLTPLFKALWPLPLCLPVPLCLPEPSGSLPQCPGISIPTSVELGSFSSLFFLSLQGMWICVYSPLLVTLWHLSLSVHVLSHS